MNTSRWLACGMIVAATFGHDATAQEPEKRAAPAMRLRAAGPPEPVTQEELIERRDAKLGEAWIRNAKWITDYDELRAKARAENRPIFAYFTRSYAP